MSHEHHHMNHGHHETMVKPIPGEPVMKLAISATLHCLVGCGLGEVSGMIIANYLGLGMVASMALAISLGFVMGFAIGIIPLIRKGFPLSRAFKIVLVAEGLSITVMELFEVGTQIAIPGVIHAGLGDGLFWFGMLISLAAGFIAALPINYIMIKRGVRHNH